MLIRLYHIIYLFRLLHYSIYFLLTSIFAQSDGDFEGSINDSEVYIKDINLEWKPYNQESNVHSMDLSELRLGFSDVKTTFTYNDSIATSFPSETMRPFPISNSSPRSGKSTPVPLPRG